MSRHYARARDLPLYMKLTRTSRSPSYARRVPPHQAAEPARPPGTHVASSATSAPPRSVKQCDAPATPPPPPSLHLHASTHLGHPAAATSRTSARGPCAQLIFGATTTCASTVVGRLAELLPGCRSPRRVGRRPSRIIKVLGRLEEIQAMNQPRVQVPAGQAAPVAQGLPPAHADRRDRPRLLLPPLQAREPPQAARGVRPPLLRRAPRPVPPAAGLPRPAAALRLQAAGALRAPAEPAGKAHSGVVPGAGPGELSGGLAAPAAAAAVRAPPSHPDHPHTLPAFYAPLRAPVRVVLSRSANFKVLSPYSQARRAGRSRCTAEPICTCCSRRSPRRFAWRKF